MSAMDPSYHSILHHRWIAWEGATNRLELQGLFTAGDLRSLADWLDDPTHPTISPEVPIMKVELSEVK